MASLLDAGPRLSKVRSDERQYMRRDSERNLASYILKKHRLHRRPGLSEHCARELSPAQRGVQ